MLGLLPRLIGDKLLYSMPARLGGLSVSTTRKPLADAAIGGMVHAAPGTSPAPDSGPDLYLAVLGTPRVRNRRPFGREP